MAIDPRSVSDLLRFRPFQMTTFRGGGQISRSPDETLDRPAVDELGMAEDIEERRPMFWLPIAIAIALFIGVAYYFFGPHSAPSVRADAGVVTKSEPSPN